MALLLLQYTSSHTRYQTRRGGMLSALVLMASNALLTPMTKEEIITKFAAVEQLKLTMAARSAGGRSASGRYKKHDTARKVFIDTVVMPSLRLGKRIEEEDWRLWFLPGDDDIQGADKLKMDAFYLKHKTDRRRSDNESYGLDSTSQQTLMTWVSRNLSGYALPQPAPSGSPPEYRLTMRDNKSYAGCTLSELARETASNRLRPDAETFLADRLSSGSIRPRLRGASPSTPRSSFLSVASPRMGAALRETLAFRRSMHSTPPPVIRHMRSLICDREMTTLIFSIRVGRRRRRRPRWTRFSTRPPTRAFQRSIASPSSSNHIFGARLRK